MKNLVFEFIVNYVGLKHSVDLIKLSSKFNRNVNTSKNDMIF